MRSLINLQTRRFGNVIDKSLDIIVPDFEFGIRFEFNCFNGWILLGDVEVGHNDM